MLDISVSSFVSSFTKLDGLVTVVLKRSLKRGVVEVRERFASDPSVGFREVRPRSALRSCGLGDLADSADALTDSLNSATR